MLIATSAQSLPQDLFKDQVLAIGKERLSAEITEFRFWSQSLSLADIKDQHRTPLEIVYEKKREMKMKIKKKDAQPTAVAQSFGLSGPNQKSGGFGLAGPGKPTATFGLAGPSQKSGGFGLAGPDKPATTFGFAGPDKDTPKKAFGLAGPDKVSDSKPSFGLASPDKKKETSEATNEFAKQGFGLAGPTENKKDLSWNDAAAFGTKTTDAEPKQADDDLTPSNKNSIEQPTSAIKKEPETSGFDNFSNFDTFTTSKVKKADATGFADDFSSDASKKPASEESGMFDTNTGGKSGNSFATFDSWGAASTSPSKSKTSGTDAFSSFASFSTVSKASDTKQSSFTDFGAFNTFTPQKPSDPQPTEEKVIPEPENRRKQSKEGDEQSFQPAPQHTGFDKEEEEVKQSSARKVSGGRKASIDSAKTPNTELKRRASAQVPQPDSDSRPETRPSLQTRKPSDCEPSFQSDDPSTGEDYSIRYSVLPRPSIINTEASLDESKFGFALEASVIIDRKLDKNPFDFTTEPCNEQEILTSLKSATDTPDVIDKLISGYTEIYDLFAKVFYFYQFSLSKHL